MIKKLIASTLCVAFLTTLMGCSGKEYAQYAQAVKEQNITRQLRMETERRVREDAQRQHEIKMATLTGKLMTAAAKTDSKNDDLMVPMMVMLLEDKWSTTKTIAAMNQKPDELATIKPPETTGELIQKSTGLLLGLGGVWLGITQSNNLADVATAGIAGAGTHNTVSGKNNTLTSGSHNTDSYNEASGTNSNVGDVITTTDNSSNTGEESPY